MGLRHRDVGYFKPVNIPVLGNILMPGAYQHSGWITIFTACDQFLWSRTHSVWDDPHKIYYIIFKTCSNHLLRYNRILKQQLSMFSYRNMQYYYKINILKNNHITSHCFSKCLRCMAKWCAKKTFTSTKSKTFWIVLLQLRAQHKGL